MRTAPSNHYSDGTYLIIIMVSALGAFVVFALLWMLRSRFGG